MEKLDSKIVILNNEKYLVYLKMVNIKTSREGIKKAITRAFVKKIKTCKDLLQAILFIFFT